MGKIWYRKKYRYRYRKYLVPEKSIGIVQHFGYRHTLVVTKEEDEEGGVMYVSTVRRPQNGLGRQGGSTLENPSETKTFFSILPLFSFESTHFVHKFWELRPVDSDGGLNTKGLKILFLSTILIVTFLFNVYDYILDIYSKIRACQVLSPRNKF